ncbi:Eco57I restriction-modification methylase domain-containing protein [Nocardia jinanensis]|uniref:Eco57I restriction-modification methylase domain-containing protein n=1 Tax=Nocardia jinanensis TaxID=382504 RepID=UPI000B0CCF62|nr:N-6 DNA methylase [Nocardia jinanensis]
MTDTLTEVKRHGKHYTPSGLARFLADRVLGQFDSDIEQVSVLDPACGDGELLLAVREVAAERLPATRLVLTGYDLDTKAIAVARQRSEELGINIDLHEGDFLDASRDLADGSFDAVITNPPYVRTQQLGQSAAQVLATRFGLSGRIDLTHPFVVLLPTLLRAGGVVGLLCSNRFLTTKAGANVRNVFQQSLQPIELYDLGDTKLFAAAVLPAIIVALNHAPDYSMKCTFTSAYEDDAAESTDASGLYQALTAGKDGLVKHDGRTIAIRAGHLVQSNSATEPWRLSHSVGDEWLQGIAAATWRTFGDVAKIRVGVKTTADKVFILDDWDQAVPRPESELLRPLITQSNLTPWRISESLATRVLYPYDLEKTKRTLVDMNKFPKAMSYLENHAEQLKGRQYVIEGGRDWFEIWVPQKPAMWAAPKIVFPDISVHARFALDVTGAIVNGNCYWISLHDIGYVDVAYLMLAVANSRLGLRFYDEVCGNKLYAGRRRWMTQYVSKLPLPHPDAPESQELVQIIRDLLATGDAPDDEQISAIDDLVESAFRQPPLNPQSRQLGPSGDSVEQETLF